MNVIDGISQGFDLPKVRRIALGANPETISDQDLRVGREEAGGEFSTILTNSTGREYFKFSSDSLQLNDGDLLYITSETATRIYDTSSTMNSLFLTEECNCRCLSCPQPPAKEDTRPWVDIALQSILLIKTAPESLGITGGEPTLKWNGLLQVLDSCREHISETSIQLLTNGRTFKDYSKAYQLRQHHDQLLVGIPLHADCDEIHDKLAGGRGAFWETVSAIHNLERAKIPVELRIVVSKANFERLPALAEFIYRNLPFVQHVAFMAIELVGKAQKNFERLWVKPEVYQGQLLKAVQCLWRRGMQPIIFNHQFCMLDEKLWPISQKTITEWKVRFTDECSSCLKRSDCGGFFYSTADYCFNDTKGIRK